LRRAKRKGSNGRFYKSGEKETFTKLDARKKMKDVVAEWSHCHWHRKGGVRDD